MIIDTQPRYVAAPGTPLQEEGPGATSLPGHMYYSIARDGVITNSYGFAPLRHGDMNGPGRVVTNDVTNYKDPLYSRTIEVSREQYDRLRDFGDQSARHGFAQNYQDVRNNCVDFTWPAVDHAGLKHGASVSVPTLGGMGPDLRVPMPWNTEGKSSLRPARNIEDVRSIDAPMPESELNTEHRNPMPARNVTQWLLSDVRMDEPAHPGHDMYRQALDGVTALNRDHGVPPSARDHDFAAAIAVNARGEGLKRVDHVLLSDDATRTFAVQGPLHSQHGLDRLIAGMDTMQALQTPLSQSSQHWTQAEDKAQALAQTQALAQQEALERNARHQGPAMTMG